MAGKKPDDAGWGKDNSEQYGLLHVQNQEKQIYERIESEQGNYMTYFDNLHKALTLAHPVPVSASDGIRVMRIIDAAILSNAEKKLIEL